MTGDDKNRTTVVAARTMLSNVSIWKNCKKRSPTKNKRTLDTKLRKLYIPAIKQRGQYRTVKYIK